MVLVEALKQVNSYFKMEPFATIIQPIIEEVLAEHKKDKYRKGTIDPAYYGLACSYINSAKRY